MCFDNANSLLHTEEGCIHQIPHEGVMYDSLYGKKLQNNVFKFKKGGHKIKQLKHLIDILRK